MINKLVRDAFDAATNNNFLGYKTNFVEHIAILHGELSKALELYNSNKGIRRLYYECKNIRSTECNFRMYDDNDNPYCVEYECRNCKFAKPGGIPATLADIIIKIFEICGSRDIDLEEALEQKMKYNNRPLPEWKKSLKMKIIRDITNVEE